MYRAVVAGDMDAFLSVFSDSVVYVAPGGVSHRGHQGVRAYIQPAQENFEVLDPPAVHIFGSGDWVCSEGTWSGVERGARERSTWRECHVVRFEGDKIVELHEYIDEIPG